MEQHALGAAAIADHEAGGREERTRRQSGEPVRRKGRDLTGAAVADDVEAGRKLFAGPCDFIWATAAGAALPPPGGPEIAFAGRSNVGKSSLLNALTNRQTLARISHTPGRTQQLNFFALGGDLDQAKLRLVDMPGYGYAAVSKAKIAGWTDLMRDFLRGRATLLRTYLLVDGRHGLKSTDLETMDLLDASAASYQVVLTKRDEVKASAQAGQVEATLAALAKRPAAFPDVLFLSSHSGEGVPDLRGAIHLLLRQSGRL